jgi:phosphoglycerol transferase MdoB-like AlkP superfamily enzyme
MNIKILQLINKLNFYVVSGLILTMMMTRSLVVDNFLGNYTDCLGCYQTWVLSVDAKLAIIAIIVLYLSYAMKSYIIRCVLRLLIISFISYYLIDIYLYKFLHQRLFFNDITTYFNLDTIIEIINRDFAITLLIAIVLLFLLVISFLFIHNIVMSLRLEKYSGGSLIVIMLGLIVFTPKIDYIDDISIRNIVDINFSSTEAVDYEEKSIKPLENKINNIEMLSCNNKDIKEPRNIILVLWESLSMYQSELFSGINNWTPNLDKLASNNRYYTNFFANNFTSLEGRVAILTGEKTFRNIASMTLDRGRVGYWNSQRNLPRLMNSLGYHTSLLDGANLEFTRTGDYMNGIGFDYVEGQEYSGYKDQPRFGFNSVADKALYNRVFEYTQGLTKPYFTTVISVTTHPPYINPETGESSIEEATKYADRSLNELYQKLTKSNYFDQGIMIIMSDHRSMTPVSKDEINKFGRQAVARIPLVVIDKSYKGIAETKEYLQQSDLLNSVQYLVSEKHCSRKGEGNLFSNPAIPSECVYHNRGDYRDHIDVYCNNGKESATVKLEGNQTRIIRGELKNSESVIEMINVSRIAARKRHEEFLLNR